MSGNDPFASQNAPHTRIARFQFVTHKLLADDVVVPNIKVRYRDTFDTELREQLTTQRGTITIVITYPVEKWRQGVVLTLYQGSHSWAFRMETINHGNDEYMTIRI